MKRTFFIVIILFSLVALFVSCSSESEKIDQPKVNPSEFTLKSNLTLSTFSNLSDDIEKQVAKTRSTDNFLTEEEAKVLLRPVLEDGKNIQKKVLNTISKDSPEYQQYSKMSEQELIILSMISVTNKQSTKTRTISNLSTGDIIGCIGAALGIPGGALGLRTGSLVTAKTGLQILKSVAARYAFGYISLAIATYQFGKCIYDIAK